MERKPVVLHVASDYPGPFSPSSVTKAVADLIASSATDFTHLLVVPRRTKRKLKAECIRDGSALYLSVFDPVATLLPTKTSHIDWVRLVRTQLLDGVQPDLVHSHKLAYEGRIGDVLAKSLGVPHVVTVRGSSDTHRLNHLPWTAPVYRSILEATRLNLWISAWARAPISKLTGYLPTEKDVLFTNAVPDSLIWPRRSAHWTSNSLVCICRLNDYRQKGVIPLINGIARASAQVPDLRLDLIGSCSDEVKSKILSSVVAAGMSEKVRLLGAMPRERITELLPSYAGLVLLSRRETFGLVYAEALLSGVPIVYSAGTGVDGHGFADKFGVVSPEPSAPAIAAALIDFSKRQVGLREALGRALERGELKGLSGTGQARTYGRLLHAAAGI